MRASAPGSHRRRGGNAFQLPAKSVAGALPAVAPHTLAGGLVLRAVRQFLRRAPAASAPPPPERRRGRRALLVGQKGVEGRPCSLLRANVVRLGNSGERIDTGRVGDAARSQALGDTSQPRQRLGVATPPDKQIGGKSSKTTASIATLQHRSAAINLGGKQQLQLRSLDGPGTHPVMSKQRHKPDSLLKATTPLPKRRNSFKADRRPEPGRSHREKLRSYAIVFLSRKFIRAL